MIVLVVQYHPHGPRTHFRLGLPLPLLSYGGSSVISTLLALGLLQSIYVQGRIASASKPRTIL